MKNRILPFVLFTFLLSWNFIQAQIHVDANAAGGGGSTWADAFTDLQDALGAANPGDTIWVAAGTYKPDGPGGDRTTPFRITMNLKLYGGFAGWEASIDERVPGNVTTLSGDLTGDDVADDFENNKSDNSMTVVHIFANVSTDALLDGFTIKGGQADGTTPGTEQYGGGMYCTGRPIIRQCIFEQNFATEYGGGLYVSGVTAQGVRVEQCRFEKNRVKDNDDTNYGGGGMCVTGVKGVGFTITGSEFSDNVGGWGGGMSVFNSTGTVDGVTFSGNTTPRQGGGIRLAVQDGNNDLDFKIINSNFENNSASFGGGLYAQQRGDNCNIEVVNSNFLSNSVDSMLVNWGQAGGGISMGLPIESNDVNVLIDGCLFDQNTSSGSGGGVAFSTNGTNNSLLVSNTEFTSNESVFHGGGLRTNVNEFSNNINIVVDSCTFSQNTTEMWTGSGFRALLRGKDVDLTLSNSTFEQNTAGLSGAAAIFGFLASSNGQVKVDRCTFKENNADYEAGLSIGSSTDAGFFEHTISHCDFMNNSGAIEGGASLLWSEVPTKFLMEDCLFDSNSAGELGAGMLIANTSPETEVTIRNSIWRNNDSPKGAAIGALPFTEEPEDFATTMEASIIFENCLVYNNGSTGDTAAIALNQTGDVKFINCTVANNPAGGLALDSISAVTLQNTILSNPLGTEFTDLTGTSEVTSLGGNLFSDDSFDDHDLTYDYQEVGDPGFVAGINNYRLASGSPAIGQGVDPNSDLPEFDLDGNERVIGCVDIGAYESDIITGMDCVTDSREALVDGSLFLSPNPATDYLQIQLPEATTQPVEVSLFDTQGKMMDRQIISSGQSINVQGLVHGMYLVKAVAGERVYSGKVVKN